MNRESLRKPDRIKKKIKKRRKRLSPHVVVVWRFLKPEVETRE